MEQSVWLDKFTGYLLVMVILLTFADFLLGKEKRKRMRERVGDWWLMLSTKTFVGFTRREAEIIRNYIFKTFGQERSWKLFGWTVLLIFLSGVVSILTLSSIIFQNYDNPGVPIFFMTINTIIPIIPQAVITYASLIITLKFLDLMTKNTNIFLLLVIIGFDLFLGLLTALASAVFVFGHWQLFLQQIHRFLSVILEFFPFDLYALPNFKPIPLYNMIRTISYWAPPLLPSFFHLFGCLLFLLSKLFEPVIKKPLALLLLRFHESEKGVLTLVGIGLGGVAKLIQVGVKTFGA